MITAFEGEFAWLSNFAPVKIIGPSNLKYPSVEHAYQASKNDIIQWHKQCTGLFTAGRVKRLSREVVLRENWDELKSAIMLSLLHQKFKKEPYRSLLLGTKDCHISEGNWWGDTYWGVDLKTGKGDNILGKHIMLVRSHLIAEASK